MMVVFQSKSEVKRLMNWWLLEGFKLAADQIPNSSVGKPGHLFLNQLTVVTHRR
jgi:hypothetical protein